MIDTQKEEIKKEVGIEIIERILNNKHLQTKDEDQLIKFINF